MSSIFICLLFLSSLVVSDFSVTSPTSGQTIAATSSFALGFTDDGNAPIFTDISSTKVLLCTGSNAEINCLATIGTFTPTASLTSYAVDLTPYIALGSNGPYYFQLYSTVAAGGYSIQYSQRFTLSGMTGTLKASDGGDTSPPDAQNNIVGTDGVSVDPSQMSVTYTLQTGKTRYAPMQMQPGTKVTHKLSMSRRYPTSAVSYFTTYTARPIQVTTITPSWSYTIVQGPNWASTANSPTGYYAASEALARQINAKSRRGYYEL